ncbi:hypothetical protein CLOM_g380 [Closterium sp. NIES-68]|nr:hypothetical protein CLOM_g380 [Closterium sp. NIES-68]GJP78506.1 hypothetical protein CLOP_g8797 [Closterium sp. NIES-67]
MMAAFAAHHSPSLPTVFVVCLLTLAVLSCTHADDGGGDDAADLLGAGIFASHGEDGNGDSLRNLFFHQEFSEDPSTTTTATTESPPQRDDWRKLAMTIGVCISPNVRCPGPLGLASCCSPSQRCCNGRCCNPQTTTCCGSRCCLSALKPLCCQVRTAVVPRVVASACCPTLDRYGNATNNVCCGGRCCNKGKCCNGKCCGRFSYRCGGTTCCPRSRKVMCCSIAGQAGGSCCLKYNLFGRPTNNFCCGQKCCRRVPGANAKCCVDTATEQPKCCTQ